MVCVAHGREIVPVVKGDVVTGSSENLLHGSFEIANSDLLQGFVWAIVSEKPFIPIGPKPAGCSAQNGGGFAVQLLQLFGEVI